MIMQVRLLTYFLNAYCVYESKRSAQGSDKKANSQHPGDPDLRGEIHTGMHRVGDLGGSQLIARLKMSTPFFFFLSQVILTWW
jgi:hypothetical protein